jgi:hypothetical protein
MSLDLELASCQIRHPHNLYYQRRPPCEVLGTLPLPGLGVILLPRKSGVLPRVIDCLDQVEAKT